MKAILELEMPKSCSECKLGFLQDNYLTCIESDFGLTSDYDYENEINPQCPLQPTEELLEALEVIGDIADDEYAYFHIDKLKQALGGSNE